MALIVLIGGSSVGKDTIQDIISKKYNIPVCVSSTTRPMRVGEVDKVTYNFIPEDKFINDTIAGKFIEKRTYQTANGIWYYGLSKDSVDINTNQLVILDQNGYYEVVKYYGQDNVIGIYLTAPERKKIDRALSRETRTDKKFYEEFYRRMGSDLYAFALVENDENVYKVENVNLDDALMKVSYLLSCKGVIA